jgi:TP901-1 family phage major tail protein
MAKPVAAFSGSAPSPNRSPDLEPQSRIMSVQKAKDFLLKIDTTGAGPFITVAGIRTRTLEIRAETVDITSLDSPGPWRELLGSAGVRSARVAGSGIFKDAQSDALLRQLAFDGAIRAFQIVLPDFGIIQGPFQVTGLEFGGRHDAEVTFEITLQSAGALQFLPL